MTEVKALILGFIGMTLLTAATCLVLGALDASGTAWGVALGLLSALGGYLLSLIVVHYAPPEHRRRRVES
jgi:hypothetical protein